jgi:hypothetical protein
LNTGNQIESRFPLYGEVTVFLRKKRINKPDSRSD